MSSSHLVLPVLLTYFFYSPPVIALHVTGKTMKLRMRKASQHQNPALTSRTSRTKRRLSEVEEDPPTSEESGLFSTIKKFIRGNAVKVTTFLINFNTSMMQLLCGVLKLPFFLVCLFYLTMCSLGFLLTRCASCCRVSHFPRNVWWNAAACPRTRVLV